VYAFNRDYTDKLRIPPIFCCRLTDLIMEVKKEEEDDDEE